MSVSNRIERDSPHARKTKTALDSKFHAMDCGFQIPGGKSEFFVSGTWILDSSGRGIPDSLCCIPNPRAQDSGFHKQKIPEFRIPRAKLPRIHGETRLSYFSPNFLRKNLEKQKTKNAENYGMNQQICWRDF